MESSSVASSAMSPESTVTSLLSSSGHLRSSLMVPEHNTTFRYRDKDYDSASAALDAYIADFENCCHDPKPLPRRPNGPCGTPSRPKLSTLRNKDVLRERLTERELDFLNLPLSSLRHRVNRDRLSMTTDELLSIPHDGSMPVTHTSAFLQGLLKQSGASQPQQHLRRSAFARKNCERLNGSSCTVPSRNQHHPSPGGGATVLRRQSAVPLKPQVDFSSVSCHQWKPRWAAGSQGAEPAASLHLPRWFTSNRSEMGCSGLTSVPDLKYPAWVQHCELSNPPPPTEGAGWEEWEELGFYSSAAPASGAPSWVAELEDYDERAHAESQQTLRDLRLQFAEQISLLATKKKGSDVIETLFRDNRIESLIQKADQVLSSLSQRAEGELCPGGSAESTTPPATPVCLSGGAKEALSPEDTEELQLFSSSHHQRVTMDLGAAAAGGDTDALTDGGSQAQIRLSDRDSSVWKQPGPAEALKQMLFRLQAVEAELQRRQPSPGASTANQRLHMEECSVLTNRPEAGEGLESSPGGPSLQSRALLHLGRLKQLVEEPRDKDRGEEEEEEREKDEDEGHYSSSSSEMEEIRLKLREKKVQI
ncbi:lung adenoma susceptibility protein 2 [Nelusetta ayraudi]|uniref:lung adenoma susceptibility protein 2 n=1 Tax=Nelusetta ayraudi TaxID=303726 RepID=UPI003F71EB6F